MEKYRLLRLTSSTPALCKAKRSSWLEELGRKAWTDERDKGKANKVAQQVRRAALAAELAAQSDKKVNKVCEQPPGLLDDGSFAQPLRLPVAQPQCPPATRPQSPLQQDPSTAAESAKPLAGLTAGHAARGFQRRSENTGKHERK